MKWNISLGLVIGGAIIALIAGFAFQSVPWIVFGAVIALIGLFFKPSKI